MIAGLSGFVLAGGKSSRMGQDKALLEFGGQPLAALAVEKLREFCAEVFILSATPALEEFGTLVPDIHPGCGPLGGMEAGLLRVRGAWSLFLPVDMPLVPAGFLEEWAHWVIGLEHTRVAMFIVEGVPQPALCLLHREVTPFVVEAVAGGEYKLLPVLENACRELAAGVGTQVSDVLLKGTLPGAAIFANVNTPGEFAAAQAKGLPQ